MLMIDMFKRKFIMVWRVLLKRIDRKIKDVGDCKPTPARSPDPSVLHKLVVLCWFAQLERILSSLWTHFEHCWFIFIQIQISKMHHNGHQSLLQLLSIRMRLRWQKVYIQVRIILWIDSHLKFWICCLILLFWTRGLDLKMRVLTL